MVDGYTKSVLTVISAALVAIVAQHGVHPSQAASDVRKVQICDDSGECMGFTTHVELSPGPIGGIIRSWALPVAVGELPSK